MNKMIKNIKKIQKIRKQKETRVIFKHLLKETKRFWMQSEK